jgi:hypothetical protein
LTCLISQPSLSIIPMTSQCRCSDGLCVKLISVTVPRILTSITLTNQPSEQRHWLIMGMLDKEGCEIKQVNSFDKDGNNKIGTPTFDSYLKLMAPLRGRVLTGVIADAHKLSPGVQSGLATLGINTAGLAEHGKLLFATVVGSPESTIYYVKPPARDDFSFTVILSAAGISREV